MENPSAPTAVRPNVDVVRRVYDAFKNRDLVQVLSLFSPDIDMAQSDEVPWGGAYKGHAGAKQFFAKLTGTVTSNVAFERFIDAGDHVVAVGRTQGAVNATGKRFDVPVAHVWKIENGRVAAVRYYIDNPTMGAALS